MIREYGERDIAEPKNEASFRSGSVLVERWKCSTSADNFSLEEFSRERMKREWVTACEIGGRVEEIFLFKEGKSLAYL